jgi:ribonuclease P protein component
VSKSSCERNLIKRRIREATKAIASEIAKNHHDYVIIAKKQILEVDYKKIYNDLKFCFKRI